MCCADLGAAVAWAEGHEHRWSFTLSNAGSYYFEDRSDLSQLTEIDWDAVQATDWQARKEEKQAEFLIEDRFPWELVSRIGVRSQKVHDRVSTIIQSANHKPPVERIPDWYY